MKKKRLLSLMLSATLLLSLAPFHAVYAESTPTPKSAAEGIASTDGGTDEEKGNPPEESAAPATPGIPESIPDVPGSAPEIPGNVPTPKPADPDQNSPNGQAPETDASDSNHANPSADSSAPVSNQGTVGQSSDTAAGNVSQYGIVSQTGLLPQADITALAGPTPSPDITMQTDVVQPTNNGRYKDPSLRIPNVIVEETDPDSGHTYPRNVGGNQTPRAAQYGVFDPSEWEYSEAMSDEFDGDELDTSKWYPYYMDWWRAAPGPAVEEGDVTIQKDGETSKLVLHGTKNRVLTFGGAAKHNVYRGFGIMGGAKDYLNYGPNTNGLPIINHAPYHDALATTYGFFEVRTKFDIGNGSIPAVWFVGFQDGGGNEKSAEIDWPEMFNAEEYPGRDNKLSFWHLKNVGANGSWERPSTDTSIAQYLDPNEDYRTDWHTIGVEWGETYVRYFFDGHLIGEYAAKIPYRMVPIISFNYRPYNNDGTLKTSTDGAKADMERDFEIDYYRVWKNKNVADPYQAPELPENGNIASYAYISQFGLTSAQYNATPPEMFQDGDYTKMVWSGLQTKNADDSDYQEEHTKLPSYTFVDFLGPVDFWPPPMDFSRYAPNSISETDRYLRSGL